ncbi:hypothetical protein [Bradyrhizobium yuanmingense]|uniref:hypothetical protein n=1 Tax=Bradyrhizobium yuanmingense TaxID=108015 RepID=UPI000563524F|nr:hypothetical protein [Bradyrhizobium yuanmingense]
MSKSNSTLSALSLYEKGLYNLKLLRMQMARRQNVGFDWVAENYREYDGFLRQFSGRSLLHSRALEIGFGARPFRLFYLINMGVDAYGVDLDAPLVKMSLSDMCSIAKKNGIERAAKSIARWMVVQRKEYGLFAEFCSRPDGKPVGFDSIVRKSEGRMIVSDGGDERFWRRFARPFDLILSEDVFEHIPEPVLDKVLELMPHYLSNDGIAIIRPNIFTGITGGHRLEWYRHTLLNPDPSRYRRSPPWDHLREDKFPADTYLNRLTRADFRTKFTRNFDILEERTMLPDLGREYLTEGVRQQLVNYSDEELFSNNVLFVLRKRAQ